MTLELTQEQKDTGWQVKKLGEVSSITMGQSPHGRNVAGEHIGLPLLNGPTEFTAFSPIPVKWTEQITKVAMKNDILFCVRGSTTGRMNIADQQYVIGRGIASLRGATLPDTRYLYFTIQRYLPSLLQRATGSTFPNISGAQLNDFEIPWPPDSVRNYITEVLGSVSDKIEANSRLIQNLEELADLTFDSHLEDLSEVLEDTTYGSLNFFGGGTPNTKTPDYWDGEVNWVTPTDVTSLKSHTLFESSRKITEAGLAACSSKLHPAGSIMMTSRATIGRFAVNQVPAATNQGFIVVQPANEYERWWIYHSMKKDVELFLLLANGATFLELSRRVFKDIPLKMFHGKTELPAIHNQIIALEAENKSLGETRNLLIRHLIG